MVRKKSGQKTGQASVRFPMQPLPTSSQQPPAIEASERSVDGTRSSDWRTRSTAPHGTFAEGPAAAANGRLPAPAGRPADWRGCNAQGHGAVRQGSGKQDGANDKGADHPPDDAAKAVVAKERALAETEDVEERPGGAEEDTQLGVEETGVAGTEVVPLSDATRGQPQKRPANASPQGSPRRVVRDRSKLKTSGSPRRACASSAARGEDNAGGVGGVDWGEHDVDHVAIAKRGVEERTNAGKESAKTAATGTLGTSGAAGARAAETLPGATTNAISATLADKYLGGGGFTTVTRELVNCSLFHVPQHPGGIAPRTGAASPSGTTSGMVPRKGTTMVVGGEPTGDDAADGKGANAQAPRRVGAMLKKKKGRKKEASTERPRAKACATPKQSAKRAGKAATPRNVIAIVTPPKDEEMECTAHELDAKKLDAKKGSSPHELLGSKSLDGTGQKGSWSASKSLDGTGVAQEGTSPGSKSIDAQKGTSLASESIDGTGVPQKGGRMASTYEGPRCETNCRGLGGVKAMSPEEINALPNLDVVVEKWRDESSGADAIEAFLFTNKHVVIQKLCDKSRKLIISVLRATGDKAIQYALVPSNGNHDPRFYRRAIVLAGPRQLEIVQRLPGYKKALNGDGEKLIAEFAQSLSKRAHVLASAPEAADVDLLRWMGEHPDQSWNDHLVWTFRRLDIVGPRFGLRVVPYFVWVDDDGKEHRRKIGERTIEMDGCVSYGMSHSGAGRAAVGSAIDPEDDKRKIIVFMHSPVPIGDMPSEWRAIIVRDYKFSNQQEHDEFVAKFSSGSLPPSLELSYPLSDELASAEIEDLQSLANECLGNMACHTGDQVTCCHATCSSPASCFGLDNGGKELWQQLCDDPHANVDAGDEEWRAHLFCSTHVGNQSAVPDLCKYCFLRTKLTGLVGCEVCGEPRCNGYRPIGSDIGATKRGENKETTMFACDGRTDDDIVNGVGVRLTEDNHMPGKHLRCRGCCSAYHELHRRSKGVKERAGDGLTTGDGLITMERCREFFTAMAMPEYIKGSNAINWKKLLDKEKGYRSFKGMDPDGKGSTCTIARGVRAVMKKTVPAAPEKCDACKSNTCDLAGEKVTDLALFNAFEKHGGLVGRAANGAGGFKTGKANAQRKRQSK